jgi:hypothetical protein
MKARCYNPTCEKFILYGAKGITLCEEWKNNFEAFSKWAVQNGYRTGLQIDRIDNTKGYSRENCRWVTPKEQQNNRTNTVYLTVFGETKPRSAWLNDSRCVVTRDTLNRRLQRGWSDERAISHPVK